jgi:protein-S-isoprenylcysteine O-methyltransferase Ste14
MRYLPAILAAVVGVMMVFFGFLTRVSGGLCDQCGDDTSPGKALVVSGLIVLLGAIVGAVWIWRRSRAERSGTRRED